MYTADMSDVEKWRQGYLLAIIAQSEDKRFTNSIEMDKANKKYMELMPSDPLI